MQFTLSETLTRAAGSFQAEHMDQAEALCRAILRADAGHLVALHLLAAVQTRLGRLLDALASTIAALEKEIEALKAEIDRLNGVISGSSDALQTLQEIYTNRVNSVSTIMRAANLPLLTKDRSHQCLPLMPT